MSTNMDLLNQIGRGLRFSKHDLDQYNEPVLLAFIRVGQSILKDLPAQMISEAVLIESAKYDPTGNVMSLIYPGQTENYKSISIEAVICSQNNLRFVDKSIVDSEFLLSVIKSNTSSIVSFQKYFPDIVRHCFDRQSFEKLLSSNMSSLSIMIEHYVTGRVDSDFINDEFIKKSIMTACSSGSAIFRSEKQHLMIEAIKEGGWPESMISHKPKDLKDAIEKVMKVTSSLLQAWQRAYIKTHEVPEVIKLMNTPARRESLEKIFTRAELIPHMKNNQAVKGRWLSHDLGL